ncbi:MAG: hypothetical protein AB7S50_10735 [Bacteroidales bacterium]
MKRNSTLFSIILTVIFALFIIYPDATAQENTSAQPLTKEQLALKKLEDNVQKNQDKVDKLMAKLAESDSLINAGNAMDQEAAENLESLEKEYAAYTKDMTAQMKVLEKSKKKQSDEEIKAIDKEMKELEKEYTVGSKAFDKKIAAENKKMLAAENLVKKGIEKEKLNKPLLKDAQKALEEAKIKLEEYENK